MESKNVVITGGTRGIGRSIAIKYAENGYNVICIYKSSTADALELESSFDNIKCFQCDISNFSLVQDVAKEILQQYKKIDIIINNAGISRYGLFSDTKEQDYNEIFDVNVKGTFNITNAFIKNMLSNQNGVIINISSMWGEVGASLEVLYSSTKGAIIAFTKAMAKEMGLSHIRVNCVTPGVINTDMINDLDPQTIECLKEETPLNRLGTPLDVANCVYFLTSDQASFITGQIIGVNGGFVI